MSCDIEFLYDGVSGAICPISTDNIGIAYGDIQITLKGLEYLQENAIMRKVYKAAKGITEVIQGL